MEQYINEDTIIKDGQYESFKDLIYCPICKKLMIEPVMCFNCQNNYCKICIDDWKSKNNICPNGCEDPILKGAIGKNRLITKFKFKCIKGCGTEIPFDDINNHYKTNCIENKKNDKKENKSSMTILTKQQADLKTKEGKNIERMISK